MYSSLDGRFTRLDVEFLLVAVGQRVEAQKQFESALEIDPVSDVVILSVIYPPTFASDGMRLVERAPKTHDNVKTNMDSIRNCCWLV